MPEKIVRSGAFIQNFAIVCSSLETLTVVEEGNIVSISCNNGAIMIIYNDM